MKKVAFVVQRCGLEVNGGAELLCLQMAQRMGKYWKTEILTTCALDYMTWDNHYPAGIEEIDGTTIKRFPVDTPRHVNEFDRLSEKLLDHLETASFEEQIFWMQSQGPVSRALVDYVKHHKDEYDAFLFFTYLYATTCFILPFVREKAWLVPTAHDEWPIYMTMWNDFFLLPRDFLFLTHEERDFFRKRFPNITSEGYIAGIGIEPPKNFNPKRFRTHYGINEPFLLYVGRIDKSKGCKELFDYFIELRNHESIPRKLVLIGKSVMEIPEHPDIISLGFVEEQTKWDAIGGCDWLVNPSPFESLSIVLLESWAVKKPVLVTENSPVLVGQCRRANGGLWYKSFQEFEYIVTHSDSLLRNSLGEQGQQYVLENYSWQTVEEKYCQLIAE